MYKASDICKNTQQKSDNMEEKRFFEEEGGLKLRQNDMLEKLRERG